MFEGLKKLWREAKKKAEEAEEFVKDDGVIRMPINCQNEHHETTMVDLSQSIDKHGMAGRKIHTIYGDIFKVDSDNNDYRITTKCCICGTALGGVVFDKNNSYSPYEEAIASLQVKQACTKKDCVIKCETKYYPDIIERNKGVSSDILWQGLIGRHAIKDMPFNPKFKTADTGCPPPSIGDERPGTPIDKEIAVLVAEMNRVGIKTTCSCQGHDGSEAYVSIRLGEGTTYLHRKDIFGPSQDELTLRWRRQK